MTAGEFLAWRCGPVSAPGSRCSTCAGDRRARAVPDARTGLRLPGRRRQRGRGRDRPRARGRPALPLRGRGGPAAPGRAVRRRAPARDDARVRGQGRPRRAIGAALRPGGRFAFTLEEGALLTAAERAAMPDADTVWLTPLDDMTAALARAGLASPGRRTTAAAHRATARRWLTPSPRTPRPSPRGSAGGRWTTCSPPPALDRVAGRGPGAEARAGRGAPLTARSEQLTAARLSPGGAGTVIASAEYQRPRPASTASGWLAPRAPPWFALGLRDARRGAAVLDGMPPRRRRRASAGSVVQCSRRPAVPFLAVRPRSLRARLIARPSGSTRDTHGRPIVSPAAGPRRRARARPAARGHRARREYGEMHDALAAELEGAGAPARWRRAFARSRPRDPLRARRRAVLPLRRPGCRPKLGVVIANPVASRRSRRWRSRRAPPSAEIADHAREHHADPNTTFAGTLVEGTVAGQPIDVLVASNDDAESPVHRGRERRLARRRRLARSPAPTSSRPSATCTWRSSSRFAPASPAPSRSSPRPGATVSARG